MICLTGDSLLWFALAGSAIILLFLTIRSMLPNNSYIIEQPLDELDLTTYFLSYSENDEKVEMSTRPIMGVLRNESEDLLQPYWVLRYWAHGDFHAPSTSNNHNKLFFLYGSVMDLEAWMLENGIPLPRPTVMRHAFLSEDQAFALRMKFT